MARFAEFFAGIGLVRLALEPLGWECAFANDISEQKADMYRARFGDDHLVVRDVASLTADDLPADLDLFTASFPCIDVSLAGNRNGLDGDHSGTFWPFAQLLREYCERRRPPAAVLIENVVGLLSSSGGRDLQRIIATLNELGYRCDLLRVDARWFVPQSRPRVFVVALRDGVELHEAESVARSTRVRPDAIRRFLSGHASLDMGDIPLPDPPERSKESLRDIVEHMDSDSSLWWPDEKVAALVEAMHERHRARMDALRKAGDGAVGTIYRRVRAGRAVGEIRTDGVAGCLRTPVGGSSVQFLAQSDGNRVRIRSMTAREYARLQGVTDDFPIVVGERQGMFGFGDAVCVPAMRWLVEHALSHLTNSHADTQAARKQVTQPRLFERRGSQPKAARYSYPVAGEHSRRDPFTVAERSAIMRKVRGKNTSPELRLRRALWREGLRYRVNVKELPGRPDIVFTRAKLAVFVDGEFWHGKKLSAERLAEMSPYWQRKIARNVERDQRVDADLADAGWNVLRVGSQTVSKHLDESAHLVVRLLHGAPSPPLPAGVEFKPSRKSDDMDGTHSDG